MEIEDLDENEFVRDIDRFLYCMKNRIEEGDLVFFNCDEDSD